MALQYVGGTSGAGTSNGYTVSLNGTLTGGIASSPAAGDIVVVFSGFANNASSAPNVSGNNSGAYTPATAAQHVNDTWDTEFRSFYQVMGGTPDTSLTITRTTNAAYGGATVVQVWRGADATTPFIGAATPASGNNGNACNPPSYDPAVTGAIVIAGGAGTLAAAAASAYTGFSGASNFIVRRADGTTADIAVAMGSFAYAGSAIDPPALTGQTTSTSASWAGVTLALRPAPDPVTGDLAATETGADTFASTGSVLVQGSLAASETGDDTFAATGTVTDPPAGPVGTMAATEQGNDTFSASGTVLVEGSLAATEVGNDTFASTGKVIVQGSMDVTEHGPPHDSFDSTGTVLVQGALAATEQGTDTFASTGKVLVAGTMAAQEVGNDTFASTGKVVVQGSLAATEAGEDVFAATGSVTDTLGPAGSMDATEVGNDGFSGSGTVVVVSGSGGGGTLVRFSSPGSAYINSYKSQIRRARKKVQAAERDPLLAEADAFKQALNEAYLALQQLALLVTAQERLRLEKEAEELRKAQAELELKAAALRAKQALEDEEEELLAANLW